MHEQWPTVGTVNRRGYDVQQKMLFVTLVGHDERFKAHLGDLFANFNLFVTFMSCLDT